MDAVKTIGSAAIAMGLLDIGWLTYRYRYHQTLFQSIQKSPLTVRWFPAVAIYLLLPYALYIWAIRDAKTLVEATTKGALTGAILYAFYDLTNYATLADWTLDMTITDALWGTTLCAIGASVGYYVGKN